LYVLGYTYNGLGQFDKAIPELEKSLKLQRKWGKKYLKDRWTFPNLGYAYFKTGQFEKAAKLYKSAEKYFQDNPNISELQSVLEIAKKDTNSAKKYIDRYISIRKKNHSAEGDILAGIGWIYSEAGLPDQAENYYRKAIKAEPENPRLMNTFAIFLLDNKRNLEEIPALMDKAMRLASCKYDYCEYSDTKARGLYKMGNNREALALLQKTWDTATFKMYFIKSHLDEIGKTVRK
jgi:tetratricopeptide (TPR) repeat protein